MAVGLLFAVGFGVAQMVSGSHLGAVVTLVASRLPATPDVKPSPRPARNFLEGHRYLTEEEYKEQAAGDGRRARGPGRDGGSPALGGEEPPPRGARAAAESDDEDG